MDIYIDLEFKCHVSNPDGLYRKFYVLGFAGKCAAYIEGCRYVPHGESWTRSDGVVFNGEMVVAWKPYDELEAAQREYEREKMADMENALAILLGGDAA